MKTVRDIPYRAENSAAAAMLGPYASRSSSILPSGDDCLATPYGRDHCPSPASRHRFPAPEGSLSLYRPDVGWQDQSRAESRGAARSRARDIEGRSDDGSEKEAPNPQTSIHQRGAAGC